MDLTLPINRNDQNRALSGVNSNVDKFDAPNDFADRSINTNDGFAIVGNNYGNIHVVPSGQNSTYESLPASLDRAELKARFDGIRPAGHSTFEWIFDDDSKRAEPIAFVDWLRAPQSPTFLVEGKAGSGKSTLMKFLSCHDRTMELLARERDQHKPLILFHSFWRVGTKLQHKMKGLLASLLFQIARARPEGFSKACDVHHHQLIPASLESWSESQLLATLKTMWSHQDGRICIFLDGLDEFDPDDDFDRLVDFIDNLGIGTKICLSVRPIKAILCQFSDARHIRLQDSTATDIETHVRTTLLEKTARLPPTNQKSGLMDDLVEEMCSKASGVFLWVHYVLKNVFIGLSNEDELEILLERINTLPSAMIDLYSHMWKIMNQENSVYQDEARKLLELEPYLPLSLFEVAIMLSDSAQHHWRTQTSRMKDDDIIALCQQQQTKILTRSAGPD